jgi:hypothetical protein
LKTYPSGSDYLFFFKKQLFNESIPLDSVSDFHLFVFAYIVLTQFITRFSASAPMSKTSLLLLLCISFTGVKPGIQAEEGCAPERCGNLTVSSPFGVVWGAEENRCAQLGFQVHCAAGILYLGYYELDFGLQILDIFYGNASLLVSDVHKHAELNPSSGQGCHLPTANTASKIGSPFSISPLNRNLVLYNCTKVPVRAVMERAGLVETVCGNNTFVRTGVRKDEPGDYALEGCNATAVVVLGPSTGVTVNASDYQELISDGFLLTWQPPPAAAIGTSSGKLSTQTTIFIILSSFEYTPSVSVYFWLFCVALNSVLFSSI